MVNLVGVLYLLLLFQKLIELILDTLHRLLAFFYEGLGVFGVLDEFFYVFRAYSKHFSSITADSSAPAVLIVSFPGFIESILTAFSTSCRLLPSHVNVSLYVVMIPPF